MLIGMVGEAGNLIPYLSSDTASSAVAGNFYVAPLKYDRNIQVIPWAAERFEVLDGGRLLRCTLRPGIFWQDGVELTADDAVFTWRMMIDPATPTAYAGDFKAIEEVRKTGRYSFDVRYPHPFPRSLSTWMGALLPKHRLEGLGAEGLRGTPLARKPVSCGPYLMDSWEAGARITLAANADYFLGRPYIDRVIYRIIPDTTTMFLELKADKLDIMESMSALQYLYQAKKPAFTEKFNTYRSLSPAYTYMGYNLKSPLFSDVRVRRALAYAINKTDIIKGALLGQGEPPIGPYKPDSWAYNHNIRDYPYDPQKALALLAEVGWLPGEDGLLHKDGHPFSFTLLTNQGNEQRITAAVIIQNQLRKVGIDVKIRTVEWAAFLKQFVMPGFFDAVVLGWTIPFDPDNYDVWHSSRSGGGLNFVGYGNKEADACLEAARSTLDQATRKEYYDRLQEILHQDQPYSFLYVPYALSAVQKRFRGVEPAPLGVFYNTEKWWVPLEDQRHRIVK
jgi:peptide/nickel transport system substrate-binding protein